MLLKEADIAHFFASQREAHRAFVVFDRDSNQGCTLEDVEAALLEMHRERMCLLASLHDVDSAVLKLDNIFMSVYLAVSCVIIAALLSTKFSTLVASLGTILLGLSWLIGSTAQESLASIVWVFCKHPIDVGDAIEVPGLLSITDGSKDATFFVEEIQLLSTVLKSTAGKYVQVSNFQLAQRPLINVRRSGPIQEKFFITVSYSTSFEQVEQLREKMMAWIQTQGRDFLPGLDVEIDSLGDQSSLRLSLEIRYKSNWQDDHLKAKRRNRWISTVKDLMSQLRIFGPAGDPSADSIQRIAMVDAPVHAADAGVNPRRVSSYTFMDKRDDFHDRRFEGSVDSQSDEVAFSQPPLLAAQQDRSRINDVLPSTAHRHSNPTTQLTAFNVRGRRGSDEHVGDLETGSRH